MVWYLVPETVAGEAMFSWDGQGDSSAPIWVTRTWEPVMLCRYGLQ